MRSLEIFRRYDIVLCDLDGVLHVGPAAIPGASELLAELDRNGPDLYFLTNNGTALPEQITHGLESLGLHIPTERLITAGQALVAEFERAALVGEPMINIGNEAAAEYIRRAGGKVIPDSEARAQFAQARAVVIGSSRALNKDVIDAACNAVFRHNVPVICTNPDVFTPVGNGEITLVAGALANLFERELGVTVRWLGKPHRPIFELALARVQAVKPRPEPRVLVVDDNVASGIQGGGQLGFDTLLVLTGAHRTRAEAEAVMQRRNVSPTYVLESIAGA